MAGPCIAQPAFADEGDAETIVLQDGTFQGTRYGYRSDVTIAVTIEGGKMAIKSAKNVKKSSANVAWKKMTGADKYQVRIASNKKMTSGKKTYAAKASAASKKITKLKKGKTYFVQVRAFDKQTKAWGAWSTAKKVKVTK